MEQSHIIEMRVVTKSSRPGVERIDDGAYKVRVSSAPEKGKANSEALGLLAEYLGVPRGALLIVRGSKSRKKLVQVEETL